MEDQSTDPFALNESAGLEKMIHAPIHQNLEKDFKQCEGWRKPGIQSSPPVKDTAEKENSHYLMSLLKSALSI